MSINSNIQVDINHQYQHGDFQEQQQKSQCNQEFIQSQQQINTIVSLNQVDNNSQLLGNLKYNHQKPLYAGILLIKFIEYMIQYATIRAFVIIYEYQIPKGSIFIFLMFSILLLCCCGIGIFLLIVRTKIDQQNNFLQCAIYIGLFLCQTYCIGFTIIMTGSLEGAMGGYIAAVFLVLLVYAYFVCIICAIIILIYSLIECNEFNILRAVVGPIIGLIIAIYIEIAYIFATPIVIIFSIFFSKCLWRISRGYGNIQAYNILNGAICTTFPILLFI